METKRCVKNLGWKKTTQFIKTSYTSVVIQIQSVFIMQANITLLN